MEKNNAELIVSYLNEILSDAHCELNYTKEYELVIAVMLSAQTTDKAVNIVTKKLFSKYDSLEKIANAELVDIENEIKALGLYKVKAKNIIGIAKILLEKYNGIVPENKSDLITLPGVGNKTANVVRIELFKLQEFPVDTHIKRISKRLNIANENDDVDIIELKLKTYFKGYDYIKLHHQIIFFGRYYCVAKNPKCDGCKLKDICIKHNQ